MKPKTKNVHHFHRLGCSTMLAGWILGSAVGLGLVAGMLIGAVGVGGIILVPSLIEFPGIDVQTAIAVSRCPYPPLSNSSLSNRCGRRPLAL